MAHIPVINYEIDDVQVNGGYIRTIWLNTNSRPILLAIKTEAEFNHALIILRNKNVIYDSETTELTISL